MVEGLLDMVHDGLADSLLLPVTLPLGLPVADPVLLGDGLPEPDGDRLVVLEGDRVPLALWVLEPLPDVVRVMTTVADNEAVTDGVGVGLRD